MDNSPPPYELEWFEIELLRGDRFELAHEESQAEWVDCDLADLTSRTRASREPVRMPPLLVSRSNPPPSSRTRVPAPPPSPPRKTLPFRERPKPVWSVDAYRGQIISLSNTHRGRGDPPAIPPPPDPPKPPKNKLRTLFSSQPTQPPPGSRAPSGDAELAGVSFPRIMIIDSKRQSLVRALTAASVLGVVLAFVLAAISAHGATATSSSVIANDTNDAGGSRGAPTVETISNAQIQTSQTSSALVFSARPVSYEPLQVNGTKSKPANTSNSKTRFSVTRRPPPRAHQDAMPSTQASAPNATQNATSNDDTAAMLRAAKSQTETSLN